MRSIKAIVGERDLAREHLGAARENSTTRADQAIYKAKLDKLNAVVKTP